MQIEQSITDRKGKMQYIGKLDRRKLGKYQDKIITEEVVLTEERIKHIKEHHPGDYETIIKHIKEIIRKPKEILDDLKNKDTIFFIGKVEKNHLNVVVKLNTTNSDKNPKNSVMTAWIIREKNLIKLREKHCVIYKEV